MKEYFLNWINTALDTTNIVESIHFDEVVDIDFQNKTGHGLVQLACEQMIRTLNLSVWQERDFLFAVCFPLGYFDSMVMWNEAMWEKAGFDLEPPSFYILKRKRFFDTWSECYHRPVELPVVGFPTIESIYRCFRGEEALKNNWEYSCDLFLIPRIE